MSTRLQPCGTPAAYRRHLRAAEPPCEACTAAVREQKQARRATERAETATRARAAAEKMQGEVDVHAVLLEVLATLRAHLRDAPAQSVAAIAKQIRETVTALEKSAPADAVNPLDEIAQRRQARRQR